MKYQSVLISIFVITEPSRGKQGLDMVILKFEIGILVQVAPS